MVKNRARKQDTRQRMEVTGEPYSVARHVVTKSQRDQWGWTRVSVDYPASIVKPTLDNGFNTGHTYSIHDNLEFEGKDAFEYGWYPTVGFFTVVEGKQYPVTVTAIEPKNSKLIVDERRYQPWVAFMLGMDIDLTFASPAPASFPNYITFAISELVSSSWDGDIEPIARLGYAFWKSCGDGRRLYWSQQQYIIEFLWMWFSDHEIITAELMMLRQNRKDETKFSLDAFRSLHSAWGSMKQKKRVEFVAALAEYLNNDLPSVEDVDDSDVVYNQYSFRPPVAPVAMEPGDKVKLKGMGIPLTVRAKSARFVVLTFETRKGEVRYSIIDWQQGAAGAHNSYGYSITNDEEAVCALEALESGGIEVSFRNRVRLVVEKVTTPRIRR